MNNKKNIEEEIKRTMDLLDENESIPSNPYFYTRVKQRIEDENATNQKYFAWLKPATLFLLLLINISTITWYINSGSEIQSESQDGLANILYDDLNLKQESTDIFNLQ